MSNIEPRRKEARDILEVLEIKQIIVLFFLTFLDLIFYAHTILIVDLLQVLKRTEVVKGDLL